MWPLRYDAVEILHVLVNLQNDFLQAIGTTNKCTVKGANYQEKYQTPPIPNSLYPKTQWLRWL